MALPNLGFADYDNGWLANLHRVYPELFVHTSFSTTASRERHAFPRLTFTRATSGTSQVRQKW